MKRNFLQCTALILMGVCAAGMLFGIPAQVTHAGLPVRPTPGLPQRPSLPAPAPQAEAGAHIRLTIEGQASEAWTEVQWMDDAGHWHPVEGWRATATNHIVTWFVQASDFRKGPFRWRAYQHEGGALVGTSASFVLPDGPDRRVEIAIVVTSPSPSQSFSTAAHQ